MRRIPGRRPIGYQSAIALQLAADSCFSPVAIAAQICAERLPMRTMERLDLTFPDVSSLTLLSNLSPTLTFSPEGWITIEWSARDMQQILSQVMNSQVPNCTSSGAELDVSMPFQVWQTLQRCSSLRRLLQLRGPIGASEKIDRLSEKAAIDPIAFPLVEHLIHVIDQISAPEGLGFLAIHKESIEICQQFDRLQAQIALFNPKTDAIVQGQFLIWIAWVQGLLEVMYRTSIED